MNAPQCKVCNRSGNGVQFQLFGSLFPFGECCADCEAELQQLAPKLQQIIATGDRHSLEALCLGRTYQTIRRIAQLAELDLGELEEALAAI